MIIAASIKQWLDHYRITYRVLHHKRVNSLEAAVSLLNLDVNLVLTIQVLADAVGEVLFIYPLGRQLDFQQCVNLLNRDLKALPAIKVNRIFNDCEAACWPAVGHPYNLEVIIDKSIRQLEYVYLASGSHTALLQMHVIDYLQLNARAKVLDITTPIDSACSVLFNQEILDSPLMFAGLKFPDLPPIAMQILQLLSMSKDHSSKELVDLIVQDPFLQQQILYYTQLPFVQEKLHANALAESTADMQHVVEHILGFDVVSHIALGVSAVRAFNLEQTTDAQEFWRHAFYAATYAQRITELVADKLHLDPAISYLAGIFHNFGLLLFSRLYTPEYKLLKKWLGLYPELAITTLERRLLGMGQALNVLRGGHAQLGEWLLRHWHMPESICVIAKEHHNLDYDGKYSLYVKIIQLTNMLLRIEGIGDGSLEPINDDLLAPLGLTSDLLHANLQSIKAAAENLDNMARSLTDMTQL